MFLAKAQRKVNIKNLTICAICVNSCQILKTILCELELVFEYD